MTTEPHMIQFFWKRLAMKQLVAGADAGRGKAPISESLYRPAMPRCRLHRGIAAAPRYHQIRLVARLCPSHRLWAGASLPIMITLLISLLACVGCGKAGPELVPVHGRVTYGDGRPVTAASICFTPDPDAHSEGILSSSLLMEDGSFDLRTYPHGDGAMIGSYKVTISLGRGTTPSLAKYTRLKDTPFKIDVPAEGIPDLVLTLR